MLIDIFPDENVLCAVSSRHSSNMSLCYGETSRSLENRRAFLEPLHIDYRELVCLKQVHANSVKYVTESDRGRGALTYDTAIESTDALITDSRSVPLVVLTADCLSVFLYDKKTPAIGLVHAGWRSTKEGIVKRAILAMFERFHTAAEQLRVAFGPCIRKCCYAVKEEVRASFPGNVTERDSVSYLDLVGANERQLFEEGVKRQNVIDCGFCTSCLCRDFFSFRREGSACGRMMSVAMLK